MPTAVAYVDQRAKSNFFSDIWTGAGKQLGNILGKGEGPQAEFSSTTEKVSAGFFDILYERARSGKDSAIKKAAEKFGKTRTGRAFIDESKKQELEMLFRSPWTWGVLAFLGVALMLFKGR